MIQANYYQEFVTMCKRNPKIARIPTKDELENAGCQLSEMSYLIEPDGRQCNPSTVNPEILSEELISLFIEKTTSPIYELSDHTIKAVEADIPDEKKKCVGCKEYKSILMFRKKSNKIPTRVDTCISCQALSRTKEVGEPIVDNVVRTGTAGYVHIDKVREFVIEAYAMGRHDEKCGIDATTSIPF